MEQAYFNSNIPIEDYKFIKIEAIKLNLTVKDYIANIVKERAKRLRLKTNERNTTDTK